MEQMNKVYNLILKKHKPLIPSLLLAILCINILWHAITGKVMIGDMQVSFEWTMAHVAAVTATVLCIIAYFIFPKIYTYLLAATLLLGIGNAINFYPVWASLSIGVGDRHISIQPFLLLIGLTSFLLWINTGKKPTDKNIDTGRMEEFCERYRSYETQALEQIIKEQRYTPEAIQAARIILEEHLNISATQTGTA